MGTAGPWRTPSGSAQRACAHHAPPSLDKTIIEGLFSDDAPFRGGLNLAHIDPSPAPQGLALSGQALYTAFGGKGGDCNATLNILGGPGVPIRYGVGGLGQGGAAACGGLGGVAATFYGASVSYGIVLTCPASNGQPPRGRWGWRRSDGRGS